MRAGMNTDAGAHSRTCYGLLTTHRCHLLVPQQDFGPPDPTLGVSNEFPGGQNTLGYGL